MTVNGRMGALHMRTEAQLCHRFSVLQPTENSRGQSCVVKDTRHGEHGSWVGSCGAQANGRGPSTGFLPVVRVSLAHSAIGAGMGRCSTCVFGCVCSLWVPTSQAQVRVVIPMHGTNLTVSTMHGDSR